MELIDLDYISKVKSEIIQDLVYCLITEKSKECSEYIEVDDNYFDDGKMIVDLHSICDTNIFEKKCKDFVKSMDEVISSEHFNIEYNIHDSVCTLTFMIKTEYGDVEVNYNF